MKTPQLITADHLKKEWSEIEVVTAEFSHAKTRGEYWVLARPLSTSGLWVRFRLAFNVFIGRYDALRWIEQ